MSNGRDDQLRDIDEDILELLEEGWRTRKYLADELDVSGRYIKERIDFLKALGYVEIVHDGFYRLSDEYEAEVSKE